MQDPTEIIIREALSSHPMPRAGSTAVSDIVMRSVHYEKTRGARRVWMTRAILASYWLSALVGTLTIVMSAPALEWRPSALTALMAWTVPVVGALVLYGHSILGAVVEWSSRYLSASFN
jgi:hypothetical protein